MRDGGPVAAFDIDTVHLRQACCGATNAHCATPMREVFTVLGTCEECGHPKGCHEATSCPPRRWAVRVSVIYGRNQDEVRMSETQTMTLVDFLLARLDEDEAVARAARDSPAFLAFARRAGKTTARTFWDRHDPARVLADVAAKRRIVINLVQPYIAERRRLMNGQPSWGDEHPDILLLLAQPYSDHPDWRSEWSTESA